MKKLALMMTIVLGMGLVPAVLAQNHGEVGAYFDYVRLKAATNNINEYGLGGRLSFNVHPNIQLEAEMSYDFARGFNENFTGISGGTSCTPAPCVNRTNLRLLHGLFGPKIQTGGSWIRAYGTVKGGFLNLRFDPRPATFSTFTSDVDLLRSNNVNGVFYPGGGVEIYAGPIGIRAEIGDLMYFNNGAHNNLRFEVGPNIRF